jgi:hypothetical protein
MAKQKRTLTGDCGEFYVASLLSGIGADVTVERVNAKRNDLNVTLGRRSFTIQVKAGRSYTNEDGKRLPKESRWVWRAGEKCIAIKDKRHWYAFVYLGEWPKKGDAPRVFFVPSRVVSKTLCENPRGQQDWFCMYKHVAEEYCGIMGIRRMKKEIAET